MQTLADVNGQTEGVAVDLNNVSEDALNSEGQLILTGEDGHGTVIACTICIRHFSLA